MLNILDRDSLLSKYLDGQKAQIRFLRVSLFFVDQEHVLCQKTFYNTTGGATIKEVAMELRSAQRQKLNLMRKLSQAHKKHISD